MGSHNKSTTYCRGFVAAFAEAERSNICHEITEANFLSVLADGSTDSGILEQDSVFLRYVDKVKDHGKVKTTLVDIVALEAGTAEGKCFKLFQF